MAVNLLWDNPVFLREARWWLLLRWLRRRIVAWPAGILLAIGIYIYFSALIGIGGYGPELWFGSILGAMTLVVVLAPLLSARVIAHERERRTWENVCLTRLTGIDVILGKWLAAQFPIVLFLLLTFPLLSVTGILFDINLLSSLKALSLLLATSALFTSFGLVCSFFIRKTLSAIVAALLISFLLCVGSVIMDRLVEIFYFNYYLNSDHPNSKILLWLIPFRLIGWLNPFYVLSALLIGSDADRRGGSHDYWFTLFRFFPFEMPPTYAISIYFVACLCIAFICLLWLILSYKKVRYA